MRQFRTSRSVRGAAREGGPYRDMVQVKQVVEKEWSMLRHAQHERILVNNFKTDSVRPELGRRTPNGFSTACKDSTLQDCATALLQNCYQPPARGLARSGVR